MTNTFRTEHSFTGDGKRFLFNNDRGSNPGRYACHICVMTAPPRDSSSLRNIKATVVND